MRRKIKLNVMLLKEGLDFQEPQSFVADYAQSQRIPIGSRTDIFLYKRLGAIKQPDWVKTFVEKVGGVDLTEIFPENQNYGVTLFIKVDDRIFAANWGMLARFNVLPDCVDKKFGIYTANKILSENPTAKIKSAQSRVNETNPVNKQRQYGDNVSTDELMLSMEDNEALKELIVQDKGSIDFQKLIGKFSTLNVQFLFEAHELPCLEFLPLRLKTLLDKYKSVTPDDIKKLHKGISPLERVPAGLLTELEGQLEAQSDALFLFEPEIDFDFSAVSKFKFIVGSQESLVDDFLLAEYLSRRTTPSVDDLKNDQIVVLDEDEREMKTWSLYECLYGEIRYANKNYILSQGEWYEIANDKYERIKQKIDEITDGSFTVSSVVKDRVRQEIARLSTGRINKEYIFNKNLCLEMGGELFDERIKQITLYEDRFEVCDIYAPPDRRFIHVKYNSGLQALSHLFNQGYVSAMAYGKFGAEYARAANGHIADSQKHMPSTHNDARIHFLIINDKRINRLTFFSKMALESRATMMEAMNYTVKLSWVQDVY